MPSLPQVVAQVESNNNMFAVRYEPAVFAKYNAIDDQEQNTSAAQIRAFEVIHKCSPDTARVLLSCSYGKYQIMGFNLNQHVLQFAANEMAQDAAFYAFCYSIYVPAANMADAAWLLDTASPAGIAFAKSYNGPGNPSAYLIRLRQAYNALL